MWFPTNFKRLGYKLCTRTKAGALVCLGCMVKWLTPSIFKKLGVIDIRTSLANVSMSSVICAHFLQIIFYVACNSSISDTLC